MWYGIGPHCHLLLALPLVSEIYGLGILAELEISAVTDLIVGNSSLGMNGEVEEGVGSRQGKSVRGIEKGVLNFYKNCMNNLLL